MNIGGRGGFLRGVASRLLPRTLKWRSLLIIIAPMLMVQALVLWAFFDRSWDTLTRHLAGLISGDIALAADTVRQWDGHTDSLAALEKTLAHLGRRTNLALLFTPEAKLEKRGADGWVWGYRAFLLEALEEKLDAPLYLDTTSVHKTVRVEVATPRGVLRASFPRSRIFSSTAVVFVGFVMGGSLLLIVVAVVIMRNQVRPIRRLAMAMDEFGKGHDAAPVKARGGTEVRMATLAFHRMRRRILRQMNQRTEMLTAVSHDLNTVLTRMKLEMAMMRGKGSDIGALQKEVEGLQGMIAEYWDFVRAGGREEKEALPVKTLWEAVDGTFAGGALRIEHEARPKGALMVKPRQFTRCVTNLVENALRHAARVRLGVRFHGRSADITVDDNGPGIPRTERAKVVRPFYRLDSSRNLDSGGSGLGLSIVRDIVHGHGGRLFLEDSPLGGLRVRIVLPA